MNWFKSLRRKKSASAAAGAHEAAEPPQTPKTSGSTPSNFTPRAQQTLALARREADRFNHNFVATEHLLLGLIRLGQGTAVTVLTKMGLDLETVRQEVEMQLGTGPDQKMVGNIPYTPRVKKVLALAAKEAKALNHTYVGTEHILLGLLDEGDGVAARVLKDLGVDIERTRQEILKELDPNASPATDNAATLSPKQSLSEPPRSRLGQDAQRPKPLFDSVDTSKRYDVHCAEGNERVVVYRNALFKSRKRLFQRDERDFSCEYLELEQANGQTIFVARISVVKFCEHGLAPAGEPVSNKPGTSA